MKPSVQGIEEALESGQYLPAKLARWYLGKVRNGFSEISDPTFYRWRQILGIPPSRSYSPDAVKRLKSLASWLSIGGTVEAYIEANSLKQEEKQSNDTARRQEQESVQQDDSLNWFSS